MSGFGRAPRVHFSGIGGTAMVAGARLAVEAGWEVRGSDNPLYPPTLDMVAALGVPVAEGYRAENLDWNPDRVVIGNALSRGNPEVEAALDRKLHYTSLPEWLKDVVLRRRRPVAVCGTHGKTTTTALTACLLDRAGFNPGFLIGGQPLDFDHSARLGSEGAPFVIEGDEYDTAFFDKRAKFFHYLPEIAVVTSVEFDHGDIYRDLGEIERAFQWMLRQIPRGGWLLACADHPGAAALIPHAPCRTATYGFDKSADWRGEWDGTFHDGLAQVAVYRQGQPWAEMAIPLAGRHNLLNALAAVAVAGTLGAEPEAIIAAMPAFRGVRRRMEVFLESRGMIFVDDFAHHPTAIRETIAAARGRWPERRLRVLFEPRSNTTVTNRFQAELTEAFVQADEVWLGPIHRAERIADDERLNREALVAELKTRGIEAHCGEDAAQMAGEVLADGRAGDLVLIMSNGAFGGIYQKFRELTGDGS
ncbi:MAG TPA: Mur ligase family protein [Candidatus Hydrogenedentes bacterium]|nr:Mur ligase family protein [Candidatus Hydrogenedentota bacterium]HPC15256.1 Mur ligase family protein [Candidatus Hydrogenedentota bacterium]HRT19489.1 Mur ligase family protein [Candidatus Hydrogenedentota bacterium]HRT64255.1 Mur ligase family protein [Candidatus Hydrogenedentota bacterium]